MTIPEKVGMQMADECRIAWINSKLPPHVVCFQPFSFWDLARLYDCLPDLDRRRMEAVR